MKNIKNVLNIVAYQKDEQGDYTLVVQQNNGYYITLENMSSFGLKNILENNDILKLESWVDVTTWMRMKDNLMEEESVNEVAQTAKEVVDWAKTLKEEDKPKSVLGDLDALTELKKKMVEPDAKPFIVDHAAALDMTKMKVLGYYIEDTVGTEKGYDGSDEPCGSETYHIVLEGGYEFTISTAHGMCGSGYCPATWGCLNSKIKLVPGNLSMMTKVSKNPIWITTSNNRSMVYFTEQDSREFYDCTTTFVRCTNDMELCRETGDGGCGYYPSGYAYINEELFTDI